MNRRNFIEFAGALSLAAVTQNLQALAQTASAGGAEALRPAPDAPETPFSEDWLVLHAQTLARAPFVAPEVKMAKELAGLSYSAYRDIRFKRDEALWKDQASPFRVEFFHGGLYFKNSVRVYVVDGGRAREYLYSPSLFTFGPLIPTPPAADSATGFSGFRVHTPLNDPNVFDEYVVFQGASYFRAVARGQVYGLSARGLAVNSGQPPGEEFPYFHSFWLTQPRPGDVSVVAYALLDSESVTGAYKFILTPGQTTYTDVTCTLFPRKPLSYVGIAPLTSMYMHGPSQRRRFDDFRPQVHDSDGLAIWNGAGEWIWRSLINPERLQFSAFTDNNPKGFGLLQRDRIFSDYQDLEGRYGDRPSVWVEPFGDWGEGSIDLLELPTADEVNDNIVAFWKPRNGLIPGSNHHYRYRLHWGWEPPVRSNMGWVASVRIGKSWNAGARLIVTEFLGTQAYNGSQMTVDLRASTGRIENVVVIPNPVTGGHRLAFDFYPNSGDASDIRGVLIGNGKPASEVWMFRWTA